MVDIAEVESVESAREAIKRIQEMDPEELVRKDKLGESFEFSEAVPAAKRLINLYRQLSLEILSDLPDKKLVQLKQLGDADYSRFSEILKFDPPQVENPSQRRQQLIDNLAGSYENTFNHLHPLIAYGLHKTTDFDRLEQDARATLQNIEDQAKDVVGQISEGREEANRILEDVRKAAAEQGVSKQAQYFKKSADEHIEQSDSWKTHAIVTAVLLGIYAVGSLFFHRFPFLSQGNLYETIQLAVSKILIFAVISTYLYLSIKNYLSHRHNAVVDRHRQNALMTYRALVDAAGDTPNKEVILVQAGACIFGPQSTGYTREGGNIQQPSAQSAIEFLTQPIKGGGEKG